MIISSIIHQYHLHILQISVFWLGQPICSKHFNPFQSNSYLQLCWARSSLFISQGVWTQVWSLMTYPHPRMNKSNTNPLKLWLQLQWKLTISSCFLTRHKKNESGDNKNLGNSFPQWSFPKKSAPGRRVAAFPVDQGSAKRAIPVARFYWWISSEIPITGW